MIRTVLRPHARAVARRFNSSAPAAPSNPQVQKVVDGAQRAYQQGAAVVGRVAGPVGQRIGNAVGGYREPIVYNTKVFSSLVRQVYQSERLTPPLDVGQWASAYSQIWSRAQSISWWRETLRNGSWVTVGIAAVEAYGIFCIGEMIGRRHLVGYKLKE